MFLFSIHEKKTESNKKKNNGSIGGKRADDLSGHAAPVYQIRHHFHLFWCDFHFSIPDVVDSFRNLNASCRTPAVVRVGTIMIYKKKKK